MIPKRGIGFPAIAIRRFGKQRTIGQKDAPA